jgi:hypothetical protein
MFVITDEIAKKIAGQHVAWLHTFCKPITSEICKRCEHNGNDHRVAAWNSEYQSPCSECDCRDFVFADKKKQARHMKLMKEEKNSC